MPFTPIGNGKYRSPSGRTFNKAQVALYHANGDKFPDKSDPTPVKPKKRTKQIAQALMSKSYGS